MGCLGNVEDQDDYSLGISRAALVKVLLDHNH